MSIKKEIKKLIYLSLPSQSLGLKDSLKMFLKLFGKVFIAKDLTLISLLTWIFSLTSLYIVSNEGHSLVPFCFAVAVLDFSATRRYSVVILSVYFILGFCFLFAHCLLPNKTQRHQKILNLLQEPPPPPSERRMQSTILSMKLPQDTKPSVFPSPKEIEIKIFLLNFFGKNPSSLVRFFSERVSLAEDIEDESFINFSLLIPRRKSLPLDHLKTILISQAGSPSVACFYSRFLEPNLVNLKADEVFSNEKISSAFKNYTDDQIKGLFTRRWNPQSYIKIIRHILASKEENFHLPVVKNIRSIEIYLETLKDRTLFYTHLKKLPITFEGISFELVKTEADRIRLGDEFDNCLRQINYGESDLVLAKKNGQNLALVEISSDGELRQVAGPHNETLYVKDYEVIVKFFLTLKDL